LESHIGHFAGLATSVLWTATSLFFTAAGRRLGPTAVNALRIVLAIVLLGATYRLLSDDGSWIPAANTRQVFFLALSGIIGLAIGDQALFTAFVQIGPRLSMLVMTTAPLFATLFGYVVLGETFGVVAALGIVLTIGGVGWVILERPAAGRTQPAGHRYGSGLALAFVAAACQAGGLLLSKQGIGHGWLPADEHMGPQAATLIRMVFAAVGMVPILALHGWRERRRRMQGVRPERTGRRSTGLALAAGGAIVGPYLGVWMSLVAAHHAPLGVAQTLCALPPVLILPFARWVYDEPISPRAVIGAVVAVVGVGLLFLGS
jgi:drug/metabolite transporter (DMT)-like permease